MIYLLDTNVVSALRRPDRSPQLLRWMADKPEDALYISVISLGEIKRGIARQKKVNPAFAADLIGWLGGLEEQFADRFILFGADDARIWGNLIDRIGYFTADLLIAATALAHDATVVSGDKSFVATGVRLENPFL